METTALGSVAAGDVLLLVGTMKGAFVFHSRPDREHWEMAGPWFQGEPVYALAYDGRGGRRRLLAAPWSFFWGPRLRASDDLGASWSNPESTPVKFSADSG